MQIKDNSEKLIETPSINEQIEAKKRKILKLFRNLDREKKQFAGDLIHQFAVVSVTLERLAEEINSGDVIENFKQGSQEIRRENPALRSYNATTKSYAALSKTLIDLLPDTSKKQAGDEIMNFAMNPQGAAKK